MPYIRRLVQGKTLEQMKKEERPEFAPPPLDPSKYAFIATRRNKRQFRWTGLLTREGFRYSKGTGVFVYDRHDDGTFVTLEEAEWVANRVGEFIAGDIGLRLGTGFFVEPLPDVAPASRSWLRRR